MNGDSRNEEFQGGAYEVKYPSFHTQQQLPPSPYTFRSVLDNVQPSANGLAPQDHARMFRGGKLPSLNGRSPSTDTKAQWLDSPYRTFG